MKKKWYFGWELLELKEWTATELLNYTKEGLQAYDELGRLILDLDTLPRKKQKTYEEVEAFLRSKWVETKPSISGTIYEKKGVVSESSKEMFSLMCKNLYDGEPLIPVIPSGYKAMSFILPTDDAEAQRFLEIVKSFHYKNQDIIGFEQSKGLAGEGQKDHPQMPDMPVPFAVDTTEDAKTEEFVRAVSISYESDTEVTIKAKKHKSKIYSFSELGFEREDSKTWLTVIEILKSPDQLLYLGPAHGEQRIRNKSYDAGHRKLREISKKFVGFLNKAYSQQLPPNYHIFEREKNEHAGAYKLKFVVANFSPDLADHKKLSKDELLSKIKHLSRRKASLSSKGDEQSEKLLYKFEDSLNAALGIAIREEWLSEDQVKSHLNPDEDFIE